MFALQPSAASELWYADDADGAFLASLQFPNNPNHHCIINPSKTIRPAPSQKVIISVIGAEV